MSALTGLRHIEFEGAHNFRDLGGYPSALGGEVRWGMVYRAGRHRRADRADMAVYDELGIRTVFDLRRDDERQRCPDPVPNVQVCLLSRVFEQAPAPRRRHARRSRAGGAVPA